MKESQFQILGSPRIVESYFKLNRNYTSDNEVHISLNASVSSNIDPESEGLAAVELRVDIFKDEEFLEVPFKITVIAEGLFTWSEELSENEEVLKRLLNQNAPAILYGYIRQEIRTMTMNASIPTLDIPVMDFTSN